MNRQVTRLLRLVVAATTPAGRAAGMPWASDSEPAGPVELDVILGVTDHEILRAMLTPYRWWHPRTFMSRLYPAGTAAVTVDTR